MPPKGAGSWPLAGGRNGTAACTKEENPNFQLWGAVRLFCLLPPKRKGIATSTNQVELLKITGFFSPRQYPFLLLLPQGWWMHSSWPCALGNLFILNVFTYLLLMYLQWLPTCQKDTGKMAVKGGKWKVKACKQEWWCVFSTLRVWGGIEFKIGLDWLCLFWVLMLILTLW